MFQVREIGPPRHECPASPCAKAKGFFKVALAKTVWETCSDEARLPLSLHARSVTKGCHAKKPAVGPEPVDRVMILAILLLMGRIVLPRDWGTLECYLLT